MKEVYHPTEDKDAGKQWTASPASDIGGAPPKDDAELNMKEADVEGGVDAPDVGESVGAGVASEARDEVKAKDAGLKTLAEPAPDSEGAAAVQQGCDSFGATDVGTPNAVSHYVGEVVPDMSRRGGSSSNIAKQVKKAGRDRKAAVA